MWGGVVRGEGRYKIDLKVLLYNKKTTLIIIENTPIIIAPLVITLDMQIVYSEYYKFNACLIVRLQLRSKFQCINLRMIRCVNYSIKLNYSDSDLSLDNTKSSHT